MHLKSQLLHYACTKWEWQYNSSAGRRFWRICHARIHTFSSHRHYVFTFIRFDVVGFKANAFCVGLITQICNRHYAVQGHDSRLPTWYQSKACSIRLPISDFLLTCIISYTISELLQIRFVGSHYRFIEGMPIPLFNTLLLLGWRTPKLRTTKFDAKKAEETWNIDRSIVW